MFVYYALCVEVQLKQYSPYSVARFCVQLTFQFNFRPLRKGKEIELAEGVGNPVYDSFNEGEQLEDVSSNTKVYFTAGYFVNLGHVRHI